MSDGTSAGIFAQLFEYAATHPDITVRRGMGLKYLAMTASYDFSLCQMDVGEHMVELGLARRVEVEGGDSDGEPIFDYEYQTENYY